MEESCILNYREQFYMSGNKESKCRLEVTCEGCWIQGKNKRHCWLVLEKVMKQFLPLCLSRWDVHPPHLTAFSSSIDFRFRDSLFKFHSYQSLHSLALYLLEEVIIRTRQLVDWELTPRNQRLSPPTPPWNALAAHQSHSGSCFKDGALRMSEWYSWLNPVKASV